MNISIFGLGYVGAVTAGCLARRGHRIIGVDVQPAKVESFNQGISPIVEPGLHDLLRDARSGGRLTATTSGPEAIKASDLSIVCVGTPSTVTGAIDLRYVRQVIKEIAAAIKASAKPHALVLRSTLLPGTTHSLAETQLQPAVRHDSIFYFPEFLREGTAVADFEEPSLAVVGTRDGSPPAQAMMEALFGPKTAVVTWATAELVKYTCNAFHAAKITFANEIGRVGKLLGIDARRVMDLVCDDTKLNLSRYYLRPGNPFGGSCLPKDVRALVQEMRVRGLHLPLLENLLPSNERHLHSLLQIILESGHQEVVILGLSFKAGTDDLRESPMVEVAQTLLGRGHTVRIYDPALNLGALVGSNKRLIDARMPHLASLLHQDLATALGQKGLIIAAQPCVPLPELQSHLTPDHRILDVNGWPGLSQLPVTCEGFCW